MKALVAVLLFASASTSAQAATFVFSAPLLGANEVPPVASPGSGTASVFINDDQLTIRYLVNFTGLIGNTTQAHIHIAPPGTNGPVATAVPSLPGFPLGVTNGSYDATFSLTDAATYNPAFLNNSTNGGNVRTAAMTLLAAHWAGNAYFNVHSTTFPAGELRANLSAIPEPATWAMMIAGFGGVGVAMRRRRQVSAA